MQKLALYLRKCKLRENADHTLSTRVLKINSILHNQLIFLKRKEQNRFWYQMLDYIFFPFLSVKTMT